MLLRDVSEMGVHTKRKSPKSRADLFHIHLHLFRHNRMAGRHREQRQRGTHTCTHTLYANSKLENDFDAALTQTCMHTHTHTFEANYK